MDQVAGIHLLFRFSDCFGTVAKHLDFVGMYGFDKRFSPLVRFNQHASEQCGIAKRGIGARASSWRHRMDGVTEQSDIRTRPRRQRDGGSHPDIVDRRGLRHLNERM